MIIVSLPCNRKRKPILIRGGMDRQIIFPLKARNGSQGRWRCPKIIRVTTGF
ncbi:hypothetical protein NIES3806_40520 [Microcystis aeruginosa NIES-3806]|nr:hypothetical protein NIES3806_40520 [Microcystis aeruginosa NIES-3806]